MRKVGVEVVGMGALKLTGFLRDLMRQKNINFESLYTVRLLKENLCYVALDYESKLSKDTQASFEVEAEGCFNLSEERFQTGEILFQPRIAGVRAMGLQQAVALCMDHCQAAELTGDDGWYKKGFGWRELVYQDLQAGLGPFMGKHNMARNHVMLDPPFQSSSVGTAYRPGQVQA
ncbi:hypothetical protein F0562_008644 [Nyssa sinensis]|uniref:Uncharacterized protein n=1 Tax=Nyssa sinensis TaxID=561372 RepID=A0A5J5ACD6_9ASTE|nr:hypothetical protein F0562_008644 [Nyssa sinensis]